MTRDTLLLSPSVMAAMHQPARSLLAAAGRAGSLSLTCASCESSHDTQGKQISDLERLEVTKDERLQTDK